MKARDLDNIGTAGVIKTSKGRVAGSKVYISADIGTQAQTSTVAFAYIHICRRAGPTYAPATGTADMGGWITRELLTMLDGPSGIEVVGADVGK